jgi:hypothetical protein
MTLDSFDVSHLILIEPEWPFDVFVSGLYRPASATPLEDMLAFPG